MKWNAFKNEMKCSVNETFLKKNKKTTSFVDITIEHFVNAFEV